MTLALVVDIVSALTVMAGLVFAIIQVRDFRQSREREMAVELLRSYQTRDFAAASRLVLDLPAGLSGPQLEAHLGDKLDLVWVFLTTVESIGVLVYRREVELDLVDDYFSGMIVRSWEKLGPYIEHLREREQRATLGEWVQWLYERMQERERAAPPVPAHVAHRDWRPT